MTSPPPDTKDWTWVLQRACPDCGFDAATLDRFRIGRAIDDNALLWEVVLAAPDATVRPQPLVWSPLEYAAHVRDVHRVFRTRLRLMIEQDEPIFPDWDQDEAALADDYGAQDPATVAEELRAEADAVAATSDAVEDAQWERRGRRSNGSEFTFDTLGRDHVHDLVHHAHDVAHVTRRLTVEAYDAFAEEYAAGASPLDSVAQADLAEFVAALGPGARVLEIGSGSGRDAVALEALGLSVRRTDVSRSFVRRLREAGHDADVLDPLTDDLADPARAPGAGAAAYDGVWANASLLHVRREDLPTVLARLAAVTRPGGVLRMAVKEGEGARFSTHGSVRAPRHFTFWREAPLRAVLEGAGWRVTSCESGRAGKREESWLEVRAERA